MERQRPDLAFDAPALYSIATMAKRGPFNGSLELRRAEVYNKHIEESKAMTLLKSLKLKTSMKSMLSLKSLRGVRRLRDSDLDCMVQLIQLVTHDIMDVDSSIWNSNVGHGNAWYSGPFLFMKRFLGVLTWDGSTHVPCQQYGYHDCREKLRAAHYAGEIINSMPIHHG